MVLFQNQNPPRKAPFETKKIANVKASAFLPENFIKTCTKLAEYYATGTGQIVGSLVSESLLQNANRISPALTLSANHLAKSASNDIFAVQGDDEDRMSAWRSLIRQEFAKRRSVVMYVPTIEEAKNISEALSKGIEEYIFVLNGSLTAKKIFTTWNTIARKEHPVFIVATSSFTILPREDIGSVIIERENERGWISQKTPFIDVRHALIALAVENKQNLYLADNSLSVETLRKLSNHEIIEGSPFKWRSVSTANNIFVNMIEEKTIGTTVSEEKEKIKFRVISPELEELIAKNINENTRMFIFASRRGLAPITVCDDCETVVSCANCLSPMTLHASKSGTGNFFLCHKCGERRSAGEKCVNCDSWRLSPLGVGIDRVKDEIQQKFPLSSIFEIDADTAANEKTLKNLLESFKNKPGSILLGTEMALNRIGNKIDHVAVASVDSLLSLPDFKMTEKIMHTLIRLRSMAERTFLVQTRKPEEKIFEYGLKGNLIDSFRMILEDRRRFEYPPYSVMVKISIEGKKDAIATQMADIVKMVSPYEIDIFPAFTSTARGKSQKRSGLIQP